MEQKLTIPVLSDTGNKTENWLKWKENFLNYLKVNNYDIKSNDLKIHLLKENIGVIGQTAIELLCKDSNKPINDMNTLLEKLDNYFDIPKNEIVERYNFFTRFQHKDESIDAYILDLKIKAETCNFGSLTNSLIRDKIIAVVKDKNLLKKLFSTENLDLIKLMTIYHEHNNAEQTKVKTPKNLNNEKVNKKKQQSKNDHETKKTNTDKLKTYCKDNAEVGVDVLNTDHEMKKTVFKRTCWRCKLNHPEKRCPAWGHKCTVCGERNHFPNCCRFQQNETKDVNTNMKLNTLNTFLEPHKMNMKATFGAAHNTGAYAVSSQQTTSNDDRNFSPGASAPAFSELENELYPNLYHIRKTSYEKNNLYLQRGNIKSENAFQKSEISLPPNPPTRNTQPPNPQTRNTQPPNHQTRNTQSSNPYAGNYNQPSNPRRRGNGQTETKEETCNLS